jgi:hypothetical protein
LIDNVQDFFERALQSTISLFQIPADVHDCLVNLTRPNEMVKGGLEHLIYKKVNMRFGFDGTLRVVLLRIAKDCERTLKDDISAYDFAAIT